MPQRGSFALRAVIALRRCMLCVGDCMEAATLVAIFVSIFVAIFLPLILSGKQWREEQDRARARRMG